MTRQVLLASGATVSADSRAVPAEPYEAQERAAGSPGGITRGDIHDHDIMTLGAFPPGAEVYCESPDPGDVLDDTDDQTAKLTRVWWWAMVAS